MKWISELADKRYLEMEQIQVCEVFLFLFYQQNLPLTAKTCLAIYDTEFDIEKIN